MAGHLLSSGVDLVIWNRTTSKTQELADRGATVATTARDLAAACQTIILCVNRTEDVEEVVGQLAEGAGPGTLIIDHSTIAPPAAQRISRELSQKGIRFVDAPVTGGSMGAQKGQLTIFLGGSEQDCEEAKEAIAPYAKRAERVGPAGAGQMAKMANQIAVGGALLGLCECLSFAAKAGLDLALIKEMVGSGAAGSWAFDNYGPKLLARDWSPGFSVKNQRKDFGYCREAAEAIDAAIPGTKLVDDLLGLLEQQGRGEETTAALFEVLERQGSKG